MDAAVMDAATDSGATLNVYSDQLVSISNDNARLIEGQRYYDAGQLQIALQRWHQLAEDETAQNLPRALGWSYISIAAQDLGDWNQAEGAIAHSFSLLANSVLANGDRTGDYWADYWAVQARVLNAQGRLQLGRGQPEAAWQTWTETEAAYKKGRDELGSIGAQINQSQALQTMGLYRRARLQLEAVVATLAAQPDSKLKAIALNSLGTVFQTAGSLEQSKAALTESLAIYQQIGSDADVASTLFSLANTLQLMQDSDGAQQHYQAVEALVPGSILQTKSQLNRFKLMLEMQQWQQAQQLLPSLFEQVKTLPASRQSVYSRVNLTESLLSPRLNVGPNEAVRQAEPPRQPIEWLPLENIAAFLQEAAQQAQTLEDNRAQAFAIGELSKLYGYTRQWSDSQALAQRALSLSQANNAQDMTYRWQRQLGKAYHQQGKDTEAIASYTSAVETLRQVRQDLLATNPDVQYSFRETVEPVYRELVSILLLPDDASEQAIGQARQVIEELQLVEIENYFKSACVDSTTEAIDNLDTQAAVIYSIVLPDRVEVVLSVPGLPLSHYRTWQTEQKTNQKISELYRYLNPVLSQNRRLSLSKEIYDWIILPAEETLTANEIATLVFVLDGQFRRIPMAALHDGKQYLLEKYGVALTPGMRLLGPHLQDIKPPEPLRALMLGLTESRGGFAALPGVKTELEQVANRVNAEVLFDQDFTQAKLATEIDRVPFPVLHLATHGQFSSNLEETFLLAWDQKISISDLDNLLRSRRDKSEPVELMVLSACQTAEGDDRAALGLAGMAIRSGARSTLATLWSVNDSSTAALVTEFYQELSNADLTKAEALRRAQIKILQKPEYSHPYYWSPFVLIGNWLS